MTIINTSTTILPQVLLGHNGTTFASLMAVLTQDATGLYAVYQAIVDDLGDDQELRQGLAQAVADRGEKLSYRGAIKSFPHLPREEYRD